MLKQQLEKLTIQELEQYRISLIFRNQQLRNMIDTCSKEGDYLGNRIDRLKIVQKNIKRQDEKNGKNSQQQQLGNKQKDRFQKQNKGLKQYVTEYTSPMIGFIKQKTAYLGYNIVETTTKLGNSILQLGTSLKNKLFTQPEDNNINPFYLTHPIPISQPQIIKIPVIQQFLSYPNPIQQPQTTSDSNKPQPQTSNQTYNQIKFLKNQQQQSNSIIQKLQELTKDLN